MATRKVLFVNNEGGGFAEQVEVSREETIQTFLERKLGGFNPDSYLVRVNRDVVTSGYVLRNGDRVSCTPSKIQGA